MPEGRKLGGRAELATFFSRWVPYVDVRYFVEHRERRVCKRRNGEAFLGADPSCRTVKHLLGVDTCSGPVLYGTLVLSPALAAPHYHDSAPHLASRTEWNRSIWIGLDWMGLTNERQGECPLSDGTGQGSPQCPCTQRRLSPHLMFGSYPPPSLCGCLPRSLGIYAVSIALFALSVFYCILFLQ